ncbi:hypothetical protein QBC43DRAFT_317277 [Cladorrhinum sp. PSN259]|nr:hypothetical protein QBC43DRAFT_317277 [Cladorrhinum sp. PSN259]
MEGQKYCRPDGLATLMWLLSCGLGTGKPCRCSLHPRGRNGHSCGNHWESLGIIGNHSGGNRQFSDAESGIHEALPTTIKSSISHHRGSSACYQIEGQICCPSGPSF